MRLSWSAMRRIANFRLIGMAAEKKSWSCRENLRMSMAAIRPGSTFETRSAVSTARG